MKQLIQLLNESGIKMTESELTESLSTYVKMAKRQGMSEKAILDPINLHRYFKSRAEWLKNNIDEIKSIAMSL